MLYLGWLVLEIRAFDSDFAGIDMTFNFFDVVKNKLRHLFAQTKRPNDHFFDFNLQELTRQYNIRTSTKDVDRAIFVYLIDLVID